MNERISAERDTLKHALVEYEKYLMGAMSRDY